MIFLEEGIKRSKTFYNPANIAAMNLTILRKVRVIKGNLGKNKKPKLFLTEEDIQKW